MSDKEINDAINRSKKIEEYNKLFNPQPNPNADLEARAAAMKLEVSIREAQAILNPPKKKMVAKLADTVKGGYGAYNTMNKAMNGDLNKLVDAMVTDLRTSSAAAKTASATAAAAAAAAKAAKADAEKEKKAAEDRFWSGGTSTTSGSYRVPTASEQKRVDDFVYDITSMGKSDPNNPYYNSSTPIPAYYPELTERSN